MFCAAFVVHNLQCIWFICFSDTLYKCILPRIKINTKGNWKTTPQRFWRWTLNLLLLLVHLNRPHYCLSKHAFWINSVIYSVPITKHHCVWIHLKYCHRHMRFIVLCFNNWWSFSVILALYFRNIFQIFKGYCLPYETVKSKISKKNNLPQRLLIML